jgi:hypothetical protein
VPEQHVLNHALSQVLTTLAFALACVVLSAFLLAAAPPAHMRTASDRANDVARSTPAPQMAVAD